ncbi:MAG TPA: nuclear transport factor 2 family protein [Parvularculaceae bacterium]|nr:nuclear transport factor 2 family protein [Parvularculaceae bacterium]
MTERPASVRVGSGLDFPGKFMRFIGNLTAGLVALLALAGPAAPARAGPEDDKATVGALDTKYQLAVKNNDAATMADILLDDFVLVVGRGDVYTKKDLLAAARNKSAIYERQDEEPGTQMVRVWGDTAVVTAKLWLKGMSGGAAFDKKLWFSDTYVRTPAGWRYAFGQSSIALPAE